LWRWLDPLSFLQDYRLGCKGHGIQLHFFANTLNGLFVNVQASNLEPSLLVIEIKDVS
jgi:hypothetical protein